MNFLIYGAGSLGLLFAYYLSKSNFVEVVTRKGRALSINENGLTCFVDGVSDKVSINSYSSIKEISQKPDCIILAVKSFDVDESIDVLSKNFREVPIVSIQNGVYAENALIKRFEKKYIFPAAVLIGSKMLDDSTIEEFMSGSMKLGFLDKQAKETADTINKIFNESGINSVVSDNIMRDKWFKFMFYCAGATLNSLTGTKNLEDEHIKWIVDEVLDEIVKVAKHVDLDFDIDLLKDEVFAFLMNFKPESWSASVGQDLNKAKKTEIDYLNGYIVNLAQQFGVDAKCNKMLVSLVKTIEQTGYFVK
jgi:2-dehydropantoate 2-reductase